MTADFDPTSFAQRQLDAYNARDLQRFVQELRAVGAVPVLMLGTPFKRYHMGPVWRGENTQRGRYREFMQCDFDTIGTKSVAADAEVILVVRQLLTEIGFTKFTVRVNDRSILNGLLQKAGLADSSAMSRTSFPSTRARWRRKSPAPPAGRNRFSAMMSLASA